MELNNVILHSGPGGGGRSQGRISGEKGHLLISRIDRDLRQVRE